MATLTTPVEGKDRGDTYTGDNEAWHVAVGNAASSGVDGLHLSGGVPADKDPTLPQNREAPPAQGVDAWKAEDGANVLAFKENKSIENTFPEGYKPPLAHPTAHGTTGLDGVEIEEDKLSKRIQRSVRAGDYEAVPQGKPPISLDQAAKEGEKVIARSEKALEAAKTDIPETEANTKSDLPEARRIPDVPVSGAGAAEGDGEQPSADQQGAGTGSDNQSTQGAADGGTPTS